MNKSLAQLLILDDEKHCQNRSRIGTRRLVSANRTLDFLRRTIFACPQNVKESAFIGMVRPILEYGNSVWDPHPDKLQE